MIISIVIISVKSRGSGWNGAVINPKLLSHSINTPAASFGSYHRRRESGQLQA